MWGSWNITMTHQKRFSFSQHIKAWVPECIKYWHTKPKNTCRAFAHEHNRSPISVNKKEWIPKLAGWEASSLAAVSTLLITDWWDSDDRHGPWCYTDDTHTSTPKMRRALRLPQSLWVLIFHRWIENETVTLGDIYFNKAASCLLNKC